MKAITLNARQPLAHILLQFLQVPSHLLLEEQLLEPGSPSHQVRKILLYCIRVRRYYWKRHSLRHLLGPLDVEKFSEKLLPNLDVPPPLEASFCLPAIPNLWNIALNQADMKRSHLNNVHVGGEEEEVGSGSNTKVIQMLPVNHRHDRKYKNCTETNKKNYRKPGK